MYSGENLFWDNRTIYGLQKPLKHHKSPLWAGGLVVGYLVERHKWAQQEVQGFLQCWNAGRAEVSCPVPEEEPVQVHSGTSAEGQFVSWGNSSLTEWDFWRSEHLLKAAVRCEPSAHILCTMWEAWIDLICQRGPKKGSKLFLAPNEKFVKVGPRWPSSLWCQMRWKKAGELLHSGLHREIQASAEMYCWV